MGTLRSCSAFPGCLLFQFLVLFSFFFSFLPSPPPRQFQKGREAGASWAASADSGRPRLPPAWALMGRAFLPQEKRPRDPVQDPPWSHPRRLSHSHQHQPGRAEQPGGEVQLHGGPHHPEDRSRVEHQQVNCWSFWDMWGAVFRMGPPPSLTGTSQHCCDSRRAVLQRCGERSVSNGLAPRPC